MTPILRFNLVSKVQSSWMPWALFPKLARTMGGGVAPEVLTSALAAISTFMAGLGFVGFIGFIGLIVGFIGFIGLRVQHLHGIIVLEVGADAQC